MTKIIRCVLFLALISFCSTNCNQQTDQIPKEFRETNSLKMNSEASSLTELGVKIINGKLEVKKVNEIHKSELILSNGKLVGTDRGEWGGKLSFKPNNATREITEIKEGNIKFIFDFKNQIYFIEGLAHSTTNEGAMYRLYTSGDSFSYKKIIEFEDAPEAFAIHNDKLLVATRKNFYLIENLKKIVVYKNILHESLHPNSIAVFDKENIYLGMRGGIAKLDLSKKTLKFYKRNE